MDSIRRNLSYFLLLLIGLGFVFSQAIEHGGWFSAKGRVRAAVVEVVAPKAPPLHSKNFTTHRSPRIRHVLCLRLCQVAIAASVCGARLMRVCGPVRSISDVLAHASAAQVPKHLISREDQVILASAGRPLGEGQLTLANRDQVMRHILVIHEKSVPYIGGTIAFLDALMRDRYPRYAQIRVANSVDEAEVEGPATIFMIGEGLGAFAMRPNCFYVHLNFSVVAMIGSPFALSLRGAQLIRKKRRLLERKVRLSDAVLDYYPAQTRALSRRLSCPVFGFLPCSETSDVSALPLADRPWDVCFVGGLSPRRKRVLAEVRARGLTLSPASGAELETLAAQSRTTLNIHMQASNHLEIPRIIGSLSTATPVVTEHSHGLKEIVDGGIISGRAGRLASLIEALVADPARLAELSEAAGAAHGRYKIRARELLHTSLNEIDVLSQAAIKAA